MTTTYRYLNLQVQEAERDIVVERKMGRGKDKYWAELIVQTSKKQTKEMVYSNKGQFVQPVT